MSQDYYLILPSNACPNIYPDNHASKFIVTWENPLEFSSDLSRWRVALTEMTYTFSPKTINNTFGVSYNQETRDEYPFSMEIEIIKAEKKPTTISFTLPEFKSPWESPKFDIGHVSKKIKITSKFKFGISFGSIEDAKKMGFPTQVASAIKEPDNTFVMWAAEAYHSESCKVEGVIIKLETPPYYTTKEYRFDKDIYWKDPKDMVTYLYDSMKHIFTNLQFLGNGKIALTIADNIVSVSFINGFNFVMGFDRVKLSGDEKHFIAAYPPQLRRGLGQMFIYANCCAPLHVGDVMVPLLRNVHIDFGTKDESDFAVIKNYVVKNPMYVPIGNSSINSIEINIRDDSGSLIPFDYGSITCLTLHFKKI